MRHKILFLTLLLALSTAVMGCGSSNDNGSGADTNTPSVSATDSETQNPSDSDAVPSEGATAQELVTALSQNLTYGDDSMMMVTEDKMSIYFRFDDAIVADKASYISATRSTANEITVFKAVDSAHVEDVKKVLEERIADQQREYEDYQPQEMEKINNALLYTNGEYVLLVMNDDTAQVKSMFDALL